jgi:hypothetical protein
MSAVLSKEAVTIASNSTGRQRLTAWTPTKCRVFPSSTAGLLLFFEPVRVEFERAAILRHRAHCVLGDAVRHLSFNLKRDFHF